MFCASKARRIFWCGWHLRISIGLRLDSWQHVGNPYFAPRAPSAAIAPPASAVPYAHHRITERSTRMRDDMSARMDAQGQKTGRRAAVFGFQQCTHQSTQRGPEGLKAEILQERGCQDIKQRRRSSEEPIARNAACTRVWTRARMHRTNERLRSELQRVQYPPKRRDARAHVCSVPTAVHHAGPVRFPAPDAR